MNHLNKGKLSNNSTWMLILKSKHSKQMLINSQQYKEKWMKIKYKIIHFTIYEKDVLKTYLNNMANQGWQIEWAAFSSVFTHQTITTIILLNLMKIRALQMMRSMFLVISSNTMKNLIIILSALLNTFQLSFFTNQDFLNRGRSTKEKKWIVFSIALLLFLSFFFISCLISVYKKVISIRQPFYCPLFWILILCPNNYLFKI